MASHAVRFCPGCSAGAKWDCDRGGWFAAHQSSLAVGISYIRHEGWRASIVIVKFKDDSSSSPYDFPNDCLQHPIPMFCCDNTTQLGPAAQISVTVP